MTSNYLLAACRREENPLQFLAWKADFTQKLGKTLPKICLIWQSGTAQRRLFRVLRQPARGLFLLKALYPSHSYCVQVLNRVYHDTEYGFPLWDDKLLFERLILEINQAGLSWITILKKADNFRAAYSRFELIKLHPMMKRIGSAC